MRPQKNIADVQALAQQYESGQLTGPEFHEAVRSLPDCATRSTDPHYQANTRHETPIVEPTPVGRSSDSTQASILSVLTRHAPLTASRVAHLAALSPSATQYQLSRLGDQGLITRSGRGTFRDPYRYVLSSHEPARAA